MDKNGSPEGKFVSRHLSQLKIVTRLFEHELDAAKGDSVAFDRELVESVLDTLEIFIEDVDAVGAGASTRAEGASRKSGDKPQVTRLN